MRQDEWLMSPCLDIFIQSVPKMYLWNKIITKIACCGAKFNHGHDLGARDPA